MPFTHIILVLLFDKAGKKWNEKSEKKEKKEVVNKMFATAAINTISLYQLLPYGLFWGVCLFFNWVWNWCFGACCRSFL